MSKKQKFVTVILLAQTLFLVLPQPLQAGQQKITSSTPDQFKEEFKSVPCKDSERLNAAKALFERMGAPAADISIEKFKDREVENLVVRKQGETDEKIIVGAHYDKVPDGCGAIDNWTGIVAIAHLYRTLKDVRLKKTILFVGFGKEEKGLIGSKAMTEAIPKEEVPKYCAMINIDSLGLTIPQVPGNLASDKLEKVVLEVAKKLDMKVTLAALTGGDADSSSFLNKKIPALTISALPQNWATIIHSVNDIPSKVYADSVFMGYRLALLLLASILDAPCGEYR
jgi:hypothetical protein